MTLTAFACVALLLAQEPRPPEVAVRTGVLDPTGAVVWSALGLGDGGVAGRHAAGPTRHGRFRTRGGVLVEARAEGVLLRFASGEDVLIDASGRAHLRDGSRTVGTLRGLRLCLADGAVVEVVTEGGERPPRLVAVRDGDVHQVLWSAGRRVSARAAERALRDTTWVALGDGRTLYEAVPYGPALVLRRELCPRAEADSRPSRQVVLLGDVLGLSLWELADRVPRHAAADPRWARHGRELARLAPRLFVPGRAYERPEGAAGSVAVPLEGGFRLELSVRQRPPRAAVVVLALWGAGGELPLTEWTTTVDTLLHFVERGSDGEPHYAMRGLPVDHLLERLVPYAVTSTMRARARDVLTAIAMPDATLADRR